MKDINRPAEELIEAYKELGSPNISDAMDSLGLKGGCLNIKPIIPGKKIVGPAFTVKYRAAGENPGTVGDYIDDTKKGDVIVLDNRGRIDCTVWGDILTYTAVMKELAGTVIDGVCRDVDGIRELEYPIYSKDYFMVTGKDRVEVDYVNEPVVLADVKVKPGDIIFADDSGVLVIPQERSEEILKIAQDITEKEENIIQELKKGKTIEEARIIHGYHELQRKE